jgi:hypothetical protein
MTVAELRSALQQMDGSLPAAVAASGPDGSTGAYPVTGVRTDAAGYGGQAVLSIGPGLPLGE